MPDQNSCGLCKAYFEECRLVAKNDYAASVVITNPINDGHLLILPRRHIISLDELTAEESVALNQILSESGRRLLARFPDMQPLHGMNWGRHSTQEHVHYQMLPSDGHIRLLHAAAHREGRAIQMDKGFTSPESDKSRLEEIARTLR